MGEFGKLFQPGRLGNIEVSNRIVMPAMGTGMAARDGSVTDALINYYVRRAQGGAGIVVTEVTNVHRSGVVPTVLDGYDDRFSEGLAKLAAGIKDGGARAFCQLYHPGRQTASRVTGHDLVAPSSVPGRPANEVPKPATAEMVQELIESYAQAAERAARAGFDGVEFHGAHGYLICAFLSPATNRRDDEYGGDTVGRARLATEIVRRTRQLLGNDFPVIFRISAEDGLPGGIDLAEGIAIARLLEAAGVDAISVSAGCYDAFERTVQPMSMAQACNAPLAAAVRRAVRVPIIVAGRINGPEVAEAVLEEGSADFVAVGRGLLTDPDFPIKAKEGRADDIRRCVACNTCIDTLFAGKPIRCMLNPELGQEGHFEIGKASQTKRVVVVGGGPAGMQAAAILAQRGHKVELYEQEDELGGKLPLCAAPEWKRGFQRLTDYLVRQLARSGVEVKLGQKVTTEMIAEAAPDAVVLACGAEPLVPEVPGLEAGRAVLADDVLLGRVAVGQKVFIMGAGYTSCELALGLARRGHEVTIARRGARIGNDLGRTSRWTVLPELEQVGVRMLAGINYEAVVADGIIVSKDGEREKISADTLILATGYRPRRELVDALGQVVPEVHTIGDCVKARTLLEALHEGAQVAAAI